MSNYQIAVLNANAADIRDLLFVSQGNLYVTGDVTNNATNVSFKEAIPWADIRSYQKLAYSAGAQKVIKINFNSALHGWVAGTKYTMSIKYYDPVDSKYKSQDFSVYAKAAVSGGSPVTIETQVITQFYNLLNSPSYPWTVTMATYLLTVTFAIGTTGTNATEPTISMPWVTADTEHNITGIADSSSTKVTITSASHGLAVGDMIDIYDVVWTGGVLPTAGDFNRTGYIVTDSATTFKVAFAIASTTYDSHGHWKEVVQMVSTAYAKPEGTAALVELDYLGGSVGGYTYVKYVINHQKQIQGAEGRYSGKELNSVIYIKTSLTEVIAYLDALLEGIFLPVIVTSKITKANPGVVTTTTDPHGLVVGDKIMITHATVSPAQLNGLVTTVASVESTTGFTLDYDASGITGEESVAHIYVFNPQKYYIGR
jgi:hypothetical protein